jgi:hypothetical protein
MLESACENFLGPSLSEEPITSSAVSGYALPMQFLVLYMNLYLISSLAMLLQACLILSLHSNLNW